MFKHGNTPCQQREWCHMATGAAPASTISRWRACRRLAHCDKSQQRVALGCLPSPLLFGCSHPHTRPLATWTDRACMPGPRRIGGFRTSQALRAGAGDGVDSRGVPGAADAGPADAEALALTRDQSVGRCVHAAGAEGLGQVALCAVFVDGACDVNRIQQLTSQGLQTHVVRSCCNSVHVDGTRRFAGRSPHSAGASATRLVPIVVRGRRRHSCFQNGQSSVRSNEPQHRGPRW